MGSAFEFILLAEEDRGNQLLDRCVEEVRRIESLLTEFSETSRTSLINNAAGIRPVKVDDEVYQLIKRCKDLSKLTQGAFDITAAAFRGLYQFKKVTAKLPSEDLIKERLELVGYEKIKLQGDGFVFLPLRGMRIGFGGIGKGYAADRVRDILIREGVGGGVINASGDLTAWGRNIKGEPWKVAVADPNGRDKTIAWIPIHNSTVATSGDYEQFFDYKGRKYAHTIDPKSGLPIHGMKSVTLLSPSAELSDALATAVFIMGSEVGLHFVNQLPNTHALLIDENNKVFTSKKLTLNLVPQ